MDNELYFLFDFATTEPLYYVHYNMLQSENMADFAFDVLSLISNIFFC